MRRWIRSEYFAMCEDGFEVLPAGSGKIVDVRSEGLQISASVPMKHFFGCLMGA